MRGLLGWAPDRRGDSKAASSPHKGSPAPGTSPGTSPAHLRPPPAPPQLLHSAAANPNNAAYSGSGVPTAPAGGRCGGRSFPAPHGRCSPLLRAGHPLTENIELHFPQGPARAGSVWPCPRPASPRPAPSRRRCRSVGGLERSPPAEAAPRRGRGTRTPLTAPHWAPAPLHSAPGRSGGRQRNAVQCSVMQCSTTQCRTGRYRAVREGRVLPPSQCRWEELVSPLFGHRTQSRRARGRCRFPRRGRCRRALPGSQGRSGRRCGGQSRSGGLGVRLSRPARGSTSPSLGAGYLQPLGRGKCGVRLSGV